VACPCARPARECNLSTTPACPNVVLPLHCPLVSLVTRDGEHALLQEVYDKALTPLELAFLQQVRRQHLHQRGFLAVRDPQGGGAGLARSAQRFLQHRGVGTPLEACCHYQPTYICRARSPSLPRGREQLFTTFHPSSQQARHLAAYDLDTASSDPYAKMKMLLPGDRGALITEVGLPAALSAL